MLLEYLESLREDQKEIKKTVDELFEDQLTSKIRKVNPKRPSTPDKKLLMLTGLSEDISDVLLTAWLKGGEIEAWGDGDEFDLCHELDIPSTTIRKYADFLVSSGIAKSHEFLGEGVANTKIRVFPPRKVFKDLSSYILGISKGYKRMGAVKKSYFIKSKKNSRWEQRKLLDIISKRSKSYVDEFEGFFTHSKGSPFRIGRRYNEAYFSQGFRFPMRRQNIPEMHLLVAAGLKETEVEILLCAWECGGSIPIAQSQDNKDRDLVRELGLSRNTIRENVKSLSKYGFIEVQNDGTYPRVRAKNPAFVFYDIAKRFEKISVTLKEFGKMWKSVSSAPNEIKRINIEKRVEKKIRKLSNGSEEIVFGFLLGKYNHRDKDIIIGEAVPIGTLSTPHNHYSPVWQEFHSKKRELRSEGKLIVAEFHTHPHEDSDIELHKLDRKRMKKMRQGKWIIFSKKSWKPFFWNMINGNVVIDEKINYRALT